jgi:hypothetical protein
MAVVQVRSEQMSKWIGIPALVVLLSVTVGCKREQVGGAPDRGVDQNLLANQADVAREYAAARPSLGTPVPPGAVSAESAAVVEVRKVVEQMSEAYKSGGIAQLVGWFSGEDAEFMGKLALAEQLPARIDNLKQAVASKGLEMPEPLKKSIGNLKISPPKEGPIGESLDGYTFGQKGEAVVVTDKEGVPLTFTKTPDGWKAALPRTDELMFITMVAEMAAGMSNYVDELTVAVNDGTITSENFEAKAEEIGKKYEKALTGPAQGVADALGAGMAEAIGEGIQESMGVMTPAGPEGTTEEAPDPGAGEYGRPPPTFEAEPPAAEEPAPAGEGEEPAVEEEEGEPIPGVPEGLIRGPRADEYRRGR